MYVTKLKKHQAITIGKRWFIKNTGDSSVRIVIPSGILIQKDMAGTLDFSGKTRYVVIRGRKRIKLDRPVYMKARYGKVLLVTREREEKVKE